MYNLNRIIVIVFNCTCVYTRNYTLVRCKSQNFQISMMKYSRWKFVYMERPYKKKNISKHGHNGSAPHDTYVTTSSYHHTLRVVMQHGPKIHNFPFYGPNLFIIGQGYKNYNLDVANPIFP